MPLFNNKMTERKSEYINLYVMGCSMLVFSFRNELSTKDLILRNSIAKSISQLQSINLLNSAGQLLDCFILYRSMVDRLGHLYYLEKTNSYSNFDDWSFVRQFDSNNNSLSDLNFKDKIDKNLFVPKKEDKDRYKSLQKSGTSWKRPNIKEEFKEKGYYFLYNFGYDHASSHVHPMANDGMIEFYRMLKNPPSVITDHFNYQTKIILANSSLVSSMTVNECLNFSSYRWIRIAFDFINSFRNAINDKPNEFESNYLKMQSFYNENKFLIEPN